MIAWRGVAVFGDSPVVLWVETVVKKRGGLDVRKLAFIMGLLVAICLTGAVVVQAQDWRVLMDGQLCIGLDKQGATWGPGDGQWAAAYVYPFQKWIPPGQDADLGYHGVDRDNVTHGDIMGGREIGGYYSWWVGVKNWTAPPAGQWNAGAEGVLEAGKTYDIFLTDNGPISLNALIDQPFWSGPEIYRRRVPQPTVVVDGTEQVPVAYDPNNTFTVDPNLKSDGMVHSKWTHPVGLTFEAWWYAFTNVEYADFILCDVHITNNGDCAAFKEGIEKPDQVLQDLWIGLAQLMMPDEDWVAYAQAGEYDGQHDHLLDYDPATRTVWFWDGDAGDIPGDDQFDPRGGPQGLADVPTGEYCATTICGYRILQVQTPQATDDPNQPATFRYMRYEDQYSPILNAAKMPEAYAYVSGQDGNPAIQAGFSDNPYQQNEPEAKWSPMLGFGPFNLNYGESIRIVYAFAAAHIDEPRAIELGYKVKNEGYDPAAAKQEIYETGKQRLWETLDKAAQVWANYPDFNVPFPPNAPSIELTSGPEKAFIKWDPVDGAVKYRVYRAAGGLDNHRVYDMIWEGTATEYTDEGLTPNFSYYYYVTAVDANGLESSHYFNRTNKAVVPFRAGLETLEKIRVVPNPFNAKGNNYVEDAPHNSTGFNFAGGPREQNTIAFVNLPPKCIIRIYNSVGDLIKTLRHESGSAEERWYPSITDYNQFPASGVYFYTVEVTEGKLKGQVGKGKFVIIR